MIEPSYVRATRAGYDAVAADYSEWVSGDLAAKPVDRALLAAFAELVHADGAVPVGDLGCGSGRVTAHLRSLGLSAFGVDLSPATMSGRSAGVGTGSMAASRGSILRMPPNPHHEHHPAEPWNPAPTRAPSGPSPYPRPLSAPITPRNTDDQGAADQRE